MNKTELNTVGCSGFMMSLFLHGIFSVLDCLIESQKPGHDFISSMVTKFYQHVLAFTFAIKEINDNPKILPNVTLGFHIYDSYYDKRLTYRTTLDLLFKLQTFIPNYECGTSKNLTAIIGGLGSDISFHMADILVHYKIPQVRLLEVERFHHIFLHNLSIRYLPVHYI